MVSSITTLKLLVTDYQYNLNLYIYISSFCLIYRRLGGKPHLLVWDEFAAYFASFEQYYNFFLSKDNIIT